MTEENTNPPPLEPPKRKPSKVQTGASSDDKNMGMLCHLLALTGLVTGWVGSIIGPLIIWIIKKDESRFVDECGKEALNFNITVLIAGFVISIVAFLGVILSVVLIGFLLLIPAGIAGFALFIAWIS